MAVKLEYKTEFTVKIRCSIGDDVFTMSAEATVEDIIRKISGRYPEIGENYFVDLKSNKDAGTMLVRRTGECDANLQS